MAEGPQALKKDPLSEIAAPRGGLFFWCCPMRFLLLLSLLYALPRKSQALHGKFTERKGLPSPSLLRNATSPIGRGTGVPVRPTRDEQSLHCPETVVPCYRDSRQLDKARLSRSCCPRKRGPPFCVPSGLRRPAESGPARQWLPPWGSWREAPERASPSPRSPKTKTAPSRKIPRWSGYIQEKLSRRC